MNHQNVKPPLTWRSWIEKGVIGDEIVTATDICRILLPVRKYLTAN